MGKAWTGSGLEDFDSWWQTERRRGLVYRGDADMEFMNNRHDITVVEFKKRGEGLGRAQLKWLQVRAGQPKTEVRIVRELEDDSDDDNRLVVFWNPLLPWAERQVLPLQQVREWMESRAYTREAPTQSGRGLKGA